MKGRGVYLREGGGRYAGPFGDREEARRFIMMMESFGESCDGVDIVETEEDVDDTTDSQTCS